MKISQKRTCEGCRAVDWWTHNSITCELKFNIDGKKGIPLEPCPKPKNNREYCSFSINKKSYEDKAEKAKEAQG